MIAQISGNRNKKKLFQKKINVFMIVLKMKIILIHLKINALTNVHLEHIYQMKIKNYVQFNVQKIYPLKKMKVVFQNVTLMNS